MIFRSNRESFNLNIVLWNAIQRLFPKEVEARKETDALYESSNSSRHLTSSEFFEEHFLGVFLSMVGVTMFVVFSIWSMLLWDDIMTNSMVHQQIWVYWYTKSIN